MESVCDLAKTDQTTEMKLHKSQTDLRPFLPFAQQARLSLAIAVGD